jgi:hypothetical protein
MASLDNDPDVLGRKFFWWTVWSALAFAVSAYLLVMR